MEKERDMIDTSKFAIEEHLQKLALEKKLGIDNWPLEKKREIIKLYDKSGLSTEKFKEAHRGKLKSEKFGF